MPFSLFAPHLPTSSSQPALPPEFNPEFQAQPSSVWFSNPQPTKQGALEYGDAFRRAAARAWSGISYGALPQEAGFVVGNNGEISQQRRGGEIGSRETTGSTTFHIPPEGVFALVHTHPRPTLTKRWVQQPSPPDIDVARNNHENVYVTSSTGLWLADPSGQVTHVFNDPSWMTSKNPQ